VGNPALNDYNWLIDELSDLCGIVPEYYDIFGNLHTASSSTKSAILGSMGMKTATEDDLLYEINKMKLRKWKRNIDPVMVFFIGQPFAVIMYVPVREGDDHNIQLRFALDNERGNREEFLFQADNIEILDNRTIADVPHIMIRVTIDSPKEIGYYDLDALYRTSNFAVNVRSKIIIAPKTCYLPDNMAYPSPKNAALEQPPEKNKSWGLCLNLYSLTSGQNWGIGDFGDLKAVGEWIAELGGGFIGINPLHMIPNKRPAGISPYSPLSRLFKNLIYLDMAAIPEVEESIEAQIIMQEPGFQNKLKELRSAATIDYEAIAALKTGILRHAFEYFYVNHYLKKTPRADDFTRYVDKGGKLLDDFALFCALQQDMISDHKLMSWRNWPEEYRHRETDQVREFRASNVEAILCQKYVQWLIDEQHNSVFRRLNELGMPVGLYHDLAVGSSDGGFDVWITQNIIAEGMDVGAPPDDFNPSGQNWGFPPVIPQKMFETGFEFLIQTVNKNMQYGGALRIDHALGMFRLFWIPSGMKPEHGAYVSYPAEIILAIIALESRRNKVVVVAEDLGTIPPEVRKTLAQFRTLGYKLLYFERNYPDPSFMSPASYSDLALCAVTTHDLPTLYGYWEGRDMRAKTELGLFPSDKLRNSQIAERQRDKILMLQALKREGLLPDTFPEDEIEKQAMIPTLCLTIYEFLARTRCRLLAVSLDDIIGTKDQQNMPGTIDAYPNWIQKTPVSLETILHNRSFQTLSRIFSKYNR
jgi:4-alpha-glucanotransferase